MTKTRGFAAVMLAAALAATATVGVQQAAADEPPAAVDYGAWQYGEDGWGTTWYDLYADLAWYGESTEPIAHGPDDWFRLRFTCPRGGHAPYVQLVGIGNWGNWDRPSRDVEYRVGEDGEVNSGSGWEAGYVTRYIRWHRVKLTYQDIRWDLVNDLANGSGAFHFRFHDAYTWATFKFPDPAGVRQAAEVLDDKCGFLADEPARFGPDIVAGEPYASTCLTRLDDYIELRAEKGGRAPNRGDVKSAAYVSHRSIPDRYKACRIAFTHPHIYSDVYICWINRRPLPDGLWVWHWAARGDISRCLAQLADWEENGVDES